MLPLLSQTQFGLAIGCHWMPLVSFWTLLIFVDSFWILLALLFFGEVLESQPDSYSTQFQTTLQNAEHRWTFLCLPFSCDGPAFWKSCSGRCQHVPTLLEFDTGRNGFVSFGTTSQMHSDAILSPYQSLSINPYHICSTHCSTWRGPPSQSQGCCRGGMLWACHEKKRPSMSPPRS